MVTPHRQLPVLRPFTSNKKQHTFRPLLEHLETRLVPSGDAVLEWNAVALDAVRNDYTVGGTPDQGGPTRTARALAIVHAAIYDAINAIDRSYMPYLFTGRAEPGTSEDAAAAQAAHDTLVALFPSQTAMFDVTLAASLQGIRPEPAAKGIELGQKVAALILAARDNDGSEVDPPYTAGTDPGDHRPDPLHPDQGFLGPGWGSVTPFVMDSGSQFQVPPPPSLTSREYAAAFNEVKIFGGDGVITPTIRTPEQTIIGTFWGYDGSPGLGTPPRLYNQVARVVAQQQRNTEVENARLFALLNIAMADAGCAIWNTKYVYNFWRPVVAIREGANDGNPRTISDSNWTYLGAPQNNGGGTNFTPNFPAYTSGHAGFGAAAFRTLADFYGRDHIKFSFTSDEFNGVTKDQFGNTRPVVTRHYKSFSQAAEENGQSRIYLGIHWQFDKNLGIRQGNQIADFVFNNSLRPVRHHDGPHHPFFVSFLPQLADKLDWVGEGAKGPSLHSTLSTDSWFLNGGNSTGVGLTAELSKSNIELDAANEVFSALTKWGMPWSWDS